MFDISNIKMPVMHPKSLNSDIWVLHEYWESPIFQIGKIKYQLLFDPGYETDGASIPRLFWRLIGHPMQMPLLIIALPHDGLYSGELCSRSEADWVFLNGMEKIKINYAKRNACWSAVRAGGWSAWNKHTARSISRSRILCKMIRA